MVMHARKQPRLNDGYADRKDTHLHQDMQYHSSLFVDGSDDNGPLGSRVSPRYQNKSSYIERNKEKRGSLSLAEKKVSHYLATGSLGRPINLDSSYSDGPEGGGGGSGGGYHDQHRSSSSSSSHHRKERPTSDRSKDYNSQHHHGSSSAPHKGGEQSRESAGHYSERENRSHTSTTSSANNGKQASSSSTKEVSAQQVQKSAIRVCGDWSEHISSSGKRYYYNCKTEVSQWEKPKDWNSEMCKTPDHRSKDGRQRLQSQTPHASKITADSRGSRHSSSSEHHQHEHSRHRANSGENTSDSFSGRDSSHPTSVPNAHPSSQHRDRERDRDIRDSRESHRNRLSVDSNSNNSNLTYPPQHHQHHPHHHHQQHHHHHHPHQRSGSTPGGNNGVPENHQDYSRSYSQHESQHHHQYSSSDYKRQGNDSSSRRRRAEGSGSHRFHDTGQGPIDDMDISPSPSPSPSSSQPSSAVGTPQQLPPTSTPGTGDTSSSHYHNSTTPQPQRSASPQGNPIPTLVNRQTAAASAPEGEAYDATIQTLRKLQNALSMHIIRAQQGNTPGSSGRPSVSQPTGRQPGAVSNSSSSGSLAPQQQLPQHPAVVMGGTTIPQHVMYQQQPQQQQGLLPLPHHHPYQQQMPQQQMLPGMPGAPLVAGSVPGSGQPLTQPHQDEAMGGRTSPVSATSSRSSCGSPTPSDSSSQNAAVAGTSQALSAAAIKREETAKLTASLSNYYNEKLIGHVLGWHADGIEKQSTKLWEEWMVNGSLQASQISVQLKRVRSQVRIAEIQSTLHEQRIMSSEQQRQEIENLKTPSNFLPS